MLTPTRPLLIGQFPSAWHPFFHFLSLFHFRSWVSPVLPLPSKSLSIWDVPRAGLSLGPLCTVGDVDWVVVRGRPPPHHWRCPLSGSARARRIGLAAGGPALGSAPLLGLCVYPTGVGYPASGLLLQLVLLRRPAASPRIGREGRAGVDWS